MKSLIFSFAFTLYFVTSAFGQLAGSPENWCREGLFTRESEDFKVAVVKSKRAKFYSDDKADCPNSASCKTSAYVVAGDTVVANRAFGSYTCGWFTSAKGGVKVGWLRTADLEFPASVYDASEKTWTGEWKYATSTINFSLSGAKDILNVKGDSYWQGLGDNVHIGELDGRASHQNGSLKYSDGDSEYDCKASMRLITEKYLMVADNGNCGGMNVSFSGIYRKTASKAAKPK